MSIVKNATTYSLSLNISTGGWSSTVWVYWQDYIHFPDESAPKPENIEMYLFVNVLKDKFLAVCTKNFQLPRFRYDY